MRRCYPILTPFKFKGAIVKPGAFIQFDNPAEGEEHGAQALQYIAAGVVDPDWVEAPEDGQDFDTEAEAAAAAEQAESDRVAAEQADRAAAEQAEADRIAGEQAEADRVAAEQAEADRIAAEQAEADRAAAEKATAKPAKGKAK